MSDEKKKDIETRDVVISLRITDHHRPLVNDSKGRTHGAVMEFVVVCDGSCAMSSIFAEKVFQTVAKMSEGHSFLRHFHQSMDGIHVATDDFEAPSDCKNCTGQWTGDYQADMEKGIEHHNAVNSLGGGVHPIEELMKKLQGDLPSIVKLMTEEPKGEA